MSHTSTLRRHFGAVLLATGLAGGIGLTAAPAEAMSSQVCISWTSTGRSYIDDKGNDIYLVEARCSLWMTTGGGDDEPSKDHETPNGASPGGDESKEEHCDFLKDELAAQRAALAWARSGLQAAEDDLERLTYKSAADYATYVDAHEEYLRALRELENAMAQYVEETDTELEYETRNGNTVVVQLAVDPTRPWGDVVIGAQEQLDRARAAERAAWDTWSRNSDPAAQAAQLRLDAINQVLGTAPTHIEELLRDLAQDC